MALPCMESDGPRLKPELGAGADDGTDVTSSVDVTMHDAPPTATTTKARGGGAAGSSKTGRAAAKKAGSGGSGSGSGKRSTASSVRGGVRSGGVRGGGSKKKSRPSSPHVKAEPGGGTTPSEDEKGVADGDGDNNDDDDGNDDKSSGGSSPPGDDNSASDNGPYCICRGPDDHRWMIQCDNCEDWFHGDCVQLDKEESENLIVSYICPNCVIPDLYMTRYRKLCPLPGCRRPARLYAAANTDTDAPPAVVVDGAPTGPAAAAPGDASAFCSDAHRDQWWEMLLERMVRETGGDGDGGTTTSIKEDKLPVDQLTPAQLMAVLAHSRAPGVAQMLLHGTTPDATVAAASGGGNGDADGADNALSAEERAITDASAAERLRLQGQVAMCKKMLLLLDMAKTRSQEALKAGYLERDGCGYDAPRLQHVGVQPHFAQFLQSAEGRHIFPPKQEEDKDGHGGDADNADDNADADDNDDDSDEDHLLTLRLGPPRFDADGQPIGVAADGGNGGDLNDNDDDKDNDNDGNNNNNNEAQLATAGMCRKRKCKAHAGWFPTLARDVRMQIHECMRQAAALRDRETRIRLAAVQRAFVMQHSTSEVRRFEGGWSDRGSVSAGEEEDNDARPLPPASHGAVNVPYGTVSS